MITPVQATHICVIGAGTMGAGIAAHLANLNFRVLLLDINVELAQKGLDRVVLAKPPHFYTSQKIDNIIVGSIEDHLEDLKEADWICEAIIEKQDLKKSLYQQIIPYINEKTFITTNTSGLQIEILSSVFPENLKKKFMGIHFFNPPRYLKLIELISTLQTDPEMISKFKVFLEEKVGRRVVFAKDTPGFISNRYGMWCIYKAIHLAEKLNLNIETVDFLTGPFIEHPKSGTFHLADIIGIDIMEDIAKNIYSRCSHDPFRKVLLAPESLKILFKNGFLGNKTNKGYYYKNTKNMKSFDLKLSEYRISINPYTTQLDELSKLPLYEKLKVIFSQNSLSAQFLKEYLTSILNYANYINKEISYTTQDFDRIMKWGFGWKHGPFELINIIGAEMIGLDDQLDYSKNNMKKTSGNHFFLNKDQEPEYRIYDDFKIISNNSGFNIRDFEDTVIGIGLTSKMGTLCPSLISDLIEYIQPLNQPFVLYSEAPSFSAGFDLKFVYDKILQKDFDNVNDALMKLQKLAEIISQKQAVSAIHGYCLGAGFEIATSCPILVAHPESKIGLPEIKVGLFPAGTGLTRLRHRSQDNKKKLIDLFKKIIQGIVARNAEEARELGYLRKNDVTCFNPDALLVKAIKLASTIQPISKPVLKLIDKNIKDSIENECSQLFQDNKVTEYDLEIGDYIKKIITRTHSWKESLEFERTYFMNLLNNEKTKERISHFINQ